MPQYTWECCHCGDRREIIAKIAEFDEVSLSDKPCQAAPLPGAAKCLGVYETCFTGSSFSFKGGAPTPRFHR